MLTQSLLATEHTRFVILEHCTKNSSPTLLGLRRSPMQSQLSLPPICPRPQLTLQLATLTGRVRIQQKFCFGASVCLQVSKNLAHQPAQAIAHPPCLYIQPSAISEKCLSVNWAPKNCREVHRDAEGQGKIQQVQSPATTNIKAL